MMPWWLHCAPAVSLVGVHERDLYECTSLLAVVVHTSDPSTQKTEAKESRVLGQPASLYSDPERTKTEQTEPTNVCPALGKQWEPESFLGAWFFSIISSNYMVC